MWGEHDFEFVTVEWEWFQYLEENSQYTTVTELVGVSVRALYKVNAVLKFKLEEAWGLKDDEGREELRQQVYLVSCISYLSLYEWT